MKSRTKKAIERMLARAVPTSPDGGSNWYQRVNRVRFDEPSGRTAMRKARGLVDEARPLMTRYEIAQWQKI